ncbi:Bromodomain and PHD finger-containing protein 3 [Spatholobus suberectus]|nr:Bromodomain and PHD finger-containing protein 3 [Spatholobus suberectus]
MGKIVEKKKGRPSLLDLQKRTLKEQQEVKRKNSAYNSDPNYRTTRTHVQRSTRRSPNPEDKDEELSTRQKKLKLVLKLPSHSKGSSFNSCGSDEDHVASNDEKRKINPIPHGSGPTHTCQKSNSIDLARSPQGTQLDSGPLTSLPDKKLLLFILDRLQKKDTYGVFSEPVDPNELPDYHEVIEFPMDFSTIRKRLDDGAYANLEQFEKDVFLICTNAMQYNAPDTIYFRQARSIQELAKKNFENLRQDSDDNEPGPRVVRRGRPPTKKLKKQPVRTSLDHAGLEFSSDAALATWGESAMWSNYDMRKGPHVLQKSTSADLSGRSHVTCNNDFCSSWLAEKNLEKIDDFAGSTFRGNMRKYGKKQVVLDENKRSTYKHSHSSPDGQEPSVLTTFDGERKLLLPVGLHSEFGYARSVAQFAANLGPVAWKIASKKIEKCLSPGIKFGRGWVGENDVKLPQHSPAPTLSSPLQPLSSQSCLSASIIGTYELKNGKSSEKPEGNILSDKHAPLITLPPDYLTTKHISALFTSSSSSVAAIKSSVCKMGKSEANEGLNSPLGGNLPRTASQVNGFNPQSSLVVVTLPGINNNSSHPAPSDRLNQMMLSPQNIQV